MKIYLYQLFTLALLSIGISIAACNDYKSSKPEPEAASTSSCEESTCPVVDNSCGAKYSKIRVKSNEISVCSNGSRYVMNFCKKDGSTVTCESESLSKEGEERRPAADQAPNVCNGKLACAYEGTTAKPCNGKYSIMTVKKNETYKCQDISTEFHENFCVESSSQDKCTLMEDDKENEVNNKLHKLPHPIEHAKQSSTDSFLKDLVGVSEDKCVSTCKITEKCSYLTFLTKDRPDEKKGKCYLFEGAQLEKSTFLRPEATKDGWVAYGYKELEDNPKMHYAVATANTLLSPLRSGKSIGTTTYDISLMECHSQCLEDEACNYATYLDPESTYFQSRSRCNLFENAMTKNVPTGNAISSWGWTGHIMTNRVK